MRDFNTKTTRRSDVAWAAQDEDSIEDYQFDQKFSGHQASPQLRQNELQT